MKKLIEVALPLEAINAESSREKSIRHGHPSTLHLWWARRPLAAARAVIWSSLVDDPSEHPELFPTEEAQKKERERLFDILRQLVVWENSKDEDILRQARAEILKAMNGEPPVFLDPFAGGGALPLEAQRLGLKVHAHDLNPVAVMINKAMIEIPPLFADRPPVNAKDRTGHLALEKGWVGAMGLADDVRYYGDLLKKEAFKRIGHLYPKVKVPPELGGGEATVIAWIWARTVKCPDPACGCEMPLARSFIVSKKKGREAWIEPMLLNGQVTYRVHRGGHPSLEGTVTRNGARCPFCGSPVELSYVRHEASSKRMGAHLCAIVAEGRDGRICVSPTAEHVRIAASARPAWTPEENMNVKSADLISGRGYGVTQWKELFTARQLTALTTFCDLIDDIRTIVEADALAAGLIDDHIALCDGGTGARAYAEAVGVYLAFVINKLVDYNSSFCSWHNSRLLISHTFGRQAIPMIWDFAEANPFSDSSGCFDSMLMWVTTCLTGLPANSMGLVRQFDAQSDCGLRNIIVSTDPPYYDNIGYADLSDFFYVWMRRTLKGTYPELFRTMLVPKAEELVATPYRFDGDRTKAKDFFEDGMLLSCQQIYKYAREDIPVTIYYAYKQSDVDHDEKSGQTASTGWETMLSAVIRAGFAITGTWPMRTEMSNRSVALETNALASSIVLVCRKRRQDATSISRRDFIAQLHRELHLALRKLHASNIAPVDMAQSSIGPGMAVYSRYREVLEADGRPLSIRNALKIINDEIDLYFNEQDVKMDADSRFCIDLYSQCCFNVMKYGEAEILANAKGASIQTMTNRGFLFARSGSVRLADRDELPRKIDRNERCIWLLAQHFTQAMKTGGIMACADLLRELTGSLADRAKDLVYRLYNIAERRNWSDEAYAYNALVDAWPEILMKANEAITVETKLKQGSIFASD